MKLSIALCTYNGALYLKEQLASIAAQTRKPDELVISDDGSTDRTQQLIEEFAGTAEFRVRWSVNQSNLGAVKNFENAIALCDGDVIALCDQDDVWIADKLESIARLMLERPEVAMMFSNAELVDENLKPLEQTLFDRLRFNKRKQNQVKSGGALEILLREPLVCGATMAFRANFSDLILPIPESGPLIHDGWIALLIAAVAEIDFVSRPLVKYRQHSAQQIGMWNTGTVENIVRSRRVDRSCYVTQANQVNEAFERLSAYGLSPRSETLLREKISHLHERAHLPAPQFQRWRSIGKEVVNRRYHRFSKGWFSAAKDLLA